MLMRLADAQILLQEYSQSYPAGTTDKPASFGIVTAIREINNSFWNAYPNEQTRSYLAKDTLFQNRRPKDFVALNTFDTAKAQFFLHGVTPKNAGKYEYQVQTWPDKTIVPWSAVTKFTNDLFTKTSGWPQMAYLGGYAGALGDWIVVDVRSKASKQILSSAAVAWTPVQPTLAAIYTASQLNIFLARLARPWSYKLTPEEVYYWHSRYPDNQLDTFTGLPKKFIGKATENNLVFYLSADIYKKEQLEYELLKDGKVNTQWKANDFDNGFVWLRDLAPGEYLLKMRYVAQKGHVTQYPFQIKTPWYQSKLFRFGELVLVGFFVGFFVVLLLNARHKRKAGEELSQKIKVQLELKAIYAQLNPHFVFNSLSSIQGLINKRDIKGANIYLSDFAKLMRDTLNNSNSDQTSIKQELETLDTYLKLEQLRFAFKYEINVDENIGIYETDIPSLLLQPLVENAVKHGVANLGEKGLITIHVKKENNNLMVTIADNGEGFSPGKITGGFGLKLTNERIKLLNELSRDQPILLEISGNSPTGAKICLIFKNWYL